MKRVTKETTMDDLMRDPRSYGIPTLQEFSRNREKYFGRHDDQMVALTEGPTKFRKDLNRIIYKVHGQLIESEEAVERVLGEYGFGLEDIKLEKQDGRLKKTIDMIPQGGGKYDVVVDFLP